MPETRNEIGCRIEEVSDPGHCRSLVETDLFHRGPYENRARPGGNKITARAPDDPRQRWSVRSQAEKLATNGSYWKRRNARHIDLTRPAPGRQHRLPDAQAPIGQLNLHIASDCTNLLDHSGSADPHAMLDGRRKQSAGEISGNYKPVIVNQQTRSHFGRQLRFGLSGLARIEKRAG